MSAQLISSSVRLKMWHPCILSHSLPSLSIRRFLIMEHSWSMKLAVKLSVDIGCHMPETLKREPR